MKWSPQPELNRWPLPYQGSALPLSYVGPGSTVERVMGIEPTPSAWKAEVLPLNYTRLDSTRQPDSHHLWRYYSVLHNPDYHRGFCPIAGNYHSLILINQHPYSIPDRADSAWFIHLSLVGGGGRIRTYEGIASRFTVCPRWPLGYPSKNKQAAHFQVKLIDCQH